MMIFCPSIFPTGFLGLYFSVQSKAESKALASCIGLRGVFDDTGDGLVVLVTNAILNGWLWRSDHALSIIGASSGAPCAQPHKQLTQSRVKLP